MKKTKVEKGITLVALIITIVVLLILAMVAINSIKRDDIISQAKEATQQWKGAVKKEQSDLGKYKEFLKSYLNDEYDDGYEPGEREGKTVKYDSNNDGIKEDWIVLTDTEGLVEIISKNPMGNLTLGREDTTVNVTSDLNGDGVVGHGDIGLASYNNAITTINNYCRSLVTATDNDGVRSVGASGDTVGNYSSTNFNSWFKNSDTKVKSGDESHKLDYEKMEKLGIKFTGVSYWGASRLVTESSDNILFCVRWVGPAENAAFDSVTIASVNSEGYGAGSDASSAVRPIIINPSGI